MWRIFLLHSVLWFSSSPDITRLLTFLNHLFIALKRIEFQADCVSLN